MAFSLLHDRHTCACACLLLAAFLLGGTSLSVDVFCCTVEHNDCESDNSHHHHVQVETRHFTYAKNKLPSLALRTGTPVCRAARGMECGSAYSPVISALDALRMRGPSPPLFILNSVLLI